MFKAGAGLARNGALTLVNMLGLKKEAAPQKEFPCGVIAQTILMDAVRPPPVKEASGINSVCTKLSIDSVVTQSNPLCVL